MGRGSKTMEVKVKKIRDLGVLMPPAKASDAGYDVVSIIHVKLKRGERISIPLGIAIEFPEGYVCKIESKSGLAINYGLYTVGGIIDSGYRGEICAIMLATDDVEIQKGQKIAQLIFYPIETPKVVYVDELSKSDRGDNGFGSTGV